MAGKVRLRVHLSDQPEALGLTCTIRAGASAEDVASLAVGETVILLHPPLSPLSRCFNMDGNEVPSKFDSLADG